ncbi:MAG: ABC transporter permease, partial [Thermoanaerobaculia bacterium]|nr:ABC transporter permease [Thermoanaerobaculia bacterium]
RVREIGLMLALGLAPRRILHQVLAEAVLLLVLGLVLGNGLAWVTVKPLEGGIDLSVIGEGMEMFGASSRLVPRLLARDVLLADAIVVLLGLCASLSPALRASRYDPVDAIARGAA